MENTIVSVEWLHKNLEEVDLIVLDASQKSNKANMESSGKNFQIANARPVNLEKDFSDPTHKFPHMLPSPLHFEAACRKLGINKSSKIVVYDNLGIYFSPRVWWMFKAMGHSAISVLDGGLPAWKNKGYPVEPVQNAYGKQGNFKATFIAEKVKDYTFITDNLTLQQAIVIDARAANRFNGLDPEPREGLRSGHIPGSLNIPFQEVLLNGQYKTKEELTKIFAPVGTDNKTLVFSCGSGVTACIVLLASELILKNAKAVYDGSWAEWGYYDKNIAD
ncbi:sulfurtransferase [Olivibacter domesticus]|uniref:Thiosulfate/3-mercaptopyruvate sulfurtransferase n=1 Tax=Olivibacter domesticus TaxID=407022 RepID=A0A1H7JDB8_OLID1|nr:sulfurtransferase [Olivibacter domesticus]SEK71970.1 thiosulfate/3-mercaptopyruvate sulfurtransferase [Olivibacter domesticus]